MGRSDVYDYEWMAHQFDTSIADYEAKQFAVINNLS